MRQVFRQLPWFFAEDLVPLKQFYAEYGQPVTFKKNTVLKCSDKTSILFYLIEGLCGYYINWRAEAPQICALALPRRTIGGYMCITGEQINISAVVMRDSKMLRIPANIFLKNMQENVEFAMAVSRNGVAKIQSSFEAAVVNMTYDPPMRLKIFFKAIICAHQEHLRDHNLVPMIFTNEELGAVINVTRVTVNRILMDWSKKGFIARNGKQIIASKALFDDIYDWLDPQ